MAEVKWIKINVDMFDDEKIKIIQSMPDGDSLLVIWIKLITLAGKTNDGGYIYIADNIPYTEEMLAVIMNKPILTIRLAIETFTSLQMINTDTKGIYLVNFERHQSIEKMAQIREQNRKRVAKHREKQKALECNVTSNVTVTQCNAIEKEREKEIEKEFHSFILADKESAKREFVGGTLGRGLVLMSDDQFDDLCEKLSLDEIEHYFGIIVECEKKGKKFTKKTHYQAILDMVAKDRKKMG